MRPRQTKLDNPTLAAEVVQGYLDGVSLKTLGSRYNVGWSTLHRVLREAGVPVRGRDAANRDRQHRAEVRHQRHPSTYTMPPDELARLRRMVGVDPDIGGV